MSWSTPMGLWAATQVAGEMRRDINGDGVDTDRQCPACKNTYKSWLKLITHLESNHSLAEMPPAIVETLSKELKTETPNLEPAKERRHGARGQKP